MKVAIITNTLYEEIIPLAKHLANHINVDLYSIISGTGCGKQIFFESDNLWQKEKPGIIKDIGNKDYINKEFKTYIDGKFQNYALYFKNLAFIKPRNLLLSYKIALFLKKKNYDLIHFNDINLLFYLLKVFMTKTTFVLTTHDPIPHSGEDDLNKKIIRKLMNRLTTIQHILHSTTLKIEFIKNCPRIFPEKINVIYYGIHEWLNYWRHRVIPDKNKILFFGRISPYKGIEYIIKAAKIVRKTIPYLKFTIAGNGKYYFNIRPIKNDDTFEVINRYIPNKELVSLIQKSSIVICPYIDATQSGVIMTAYTFNKPVIATSVGGIHEVVEDNITGKLVPPKDSLSLAHAIIELMNNGNRLAEMSKNIERIYSSGKFSWNHIAKQTFEVYKKATESA